MDAIRATASVIGVSLLVVWVWGGAHAQEALIAGWARALGFGS